MEGYGIPLARVLNIGDMHTAMLLFIKRSSFSASTDTEWYSHVEGSVQLFDFESISRTSICSIA